MGGRRKDRQDEGAGDASKERARAGRSERGRPAARAAGGAPAFRMPDPCRTVQVSAPAVLPPALPERGGREGAEDGPPEAALAEADARGALPKRLRLSLVSLLSRPVTISAIDNFLTEEECWSWITWGEERGFEEARQKQNSVYAHRDNGRIEFSCPDTAYQIWLRMRPFMPEAVGSPPRKVLGCSPRIRVYRYARGQRFGQHVDGSRDEPEMGGRTHYTVLVYLNGGDRDASGPRVRGGETVFWKDHDCRRPALAFPPTRGVCLFHGHGDECMTHEGAGVEEGTKYVLRTDVVYELER